MIIPTPQVSYSFRLAQAAMPKQVHSLPSSLYLKISHKAIIEVLARTVVSSKTLTEEESTSKLLT